MYIAVYKKDILDLYRKDIVKFAKGYEYKVLSIFDEIPKPCFNASEPTVGLSLYRERLTLKMYMADTGLLITHAFNENKSMQQEVAENIVNGKLNISNGMFLENVIAQIFRTKGKTLYFYSRIDSKDSKNTMEIDFLIRDETNPNKISPVEVKSGKYYTISSLNKFTNKFKSKLGQKYLLHTKDLKIKDDIIYLPVYMAMFI